MLTVKKRERVSGGHRHCGRGWCLEPSVRLVDVRRSERWGFDALGQTTMNCIFCPDPYNPGTPEFYASHAPRLYSFALGLGLAAL